MEGTAAEQCQERYCYRSTHILSESTGTGVVEAGGTMLDVRFNSTKKSVGTHFPSSQHALDTKLSLRHHFNNKKM